MDFGPDVTWRVVSAKSTGTSHMETNTPCQDRYLTREVTTSHGAGVLIAVVSDGAGSAVCAEDGANEVCAAIVEVVTETLDKYERLEDIGDVFIRSWFTAARERLRILAGKSEHEIRDYSATAIVAVVGDTASVYAHVGDGGAVIRQAQTQEFSVAIWPESGEYANETFFVSDPNVAEHVQVKRFGCVDDVILFSDGLQRLALHAATRSPYAPFFTPLVNHVRASKKALHVLSSELEYFLSSDAVSSRTDDDKSLVIGCRL
jgi:hypothetical protein